MVAGLIVSISYENTTGFNDTSIWEFYGPAGDLPAVTYSHALYEGTSPAPSDGSKAVKISLGDAFADTKTVYFQTPYSGTKIAVPATATQAAISADIYDNSTYAKARIWTALFDGGTGITESNSFTEYSANQASWQTISGSVSWTAACDGLQLMIRLYDEI